MTTTANNAGAQAEPLRPAGAGTSPDPGKVAEMALRVWGYKQGEVVSLMIYLGDRLGIYRALAGAGPVTAGALAASTGLHPGGCWNGCAARPPLGWWSPPTDRSSSCPRRPRRCWPTRRAACGSQPGPSRAPPRPSRPWAGWPSRSAPAAASASMTSVRPRPPRSSARSAPGRGWRWCPGSCPRWTGVTGRLESRIRVADVGCGSGITLLILAAAYPRSRFDGYDPSEYAISRARHNLAGRGLANAAFHRQAADHLPGEPVFGLALTFDCLHDMPRPDQVARAIRRCITGDGTWLIKEIRAGESWRDNLAHPVAAMLYGNSVASCLPSGLSEPGGAGLGTLGLPPSRLEKLCRQAGFSRFEVHDAGDPANLYYEVRPWGDRQK